MSSIFAYLAAKAGVHLGKGGRMTWIQTDDGLILYIADTKKATVRTDDSGWWTWLLNERLEAGVANTEDDAKAQAEAALVR